MDLDNNNTMLLSVMASTVVSSTEQCGGPNWCKREAVLHLAFAQEVAAVEEAFQGHGWLRRRRRRRYVNSFTCGATASGSMAGQHGSYGVSEGVNLQHEPLNARCGKLGQHVHEPCGHECCSSYDCPCMAHAWHDMLSETGAVL